VLLDAPLVQAQEDRSIRVADVAEVRMSRGALGVTEEALLPPEAPGHVGHPDDRPGALHGLSPVISVCFESPEPMNLSIVSLMIH
jgi:hypothetical protein